MDWLEQFVGHISTVELILKGLLIGIVVSAPLGPVGVMCIRRTLNKGRWHGFVTGVGASFSDLIYAGVTAFGMSFVYDFINNEHTMFLLQLAGGILLLIFGLYTFRSNPHGYQSNSTEKVYAIPITKKKLAYNFITGFFVTISNPLIIFLFVAMFARFSFVLPELGMVERVWGYVAVWIGTLLWWFFITAVVNKLRTRFDVRGVWLLNRIIGGVVMLASVVCIAVTLLGQRC